MKIVTHDIAGETNEVYSSPTLRISVDTEMGEAEVTLTTLDGTGTAKGCFYVSSLIEVLRALEAENE